MSGGSWDYLYCKVDDASCRLQAKKSSAIRRAFGKHLDLVAKALHDIEWVDSCDFGPGDEEAAIRAVLGASASAQILGEVTKEAREVAAELNGLLSKIDEGKR